MYQLITSSVRRLAFAFKLASHRAQFPGMLRAIAGFLKNHGDSDFYDLKRGDYIIPLTVKDDVLKNFATAMSLYPDVVSIGKAQTMTVMREDNPHSIPEPALNFVLTVGQMLTNIAITFDLYSYTYKEKGFEQYNVPGVPELIDGLFKIWGTREKVNVTSLSLEYNGKSSGTAKKDIIKKLNQSADVIDKILEKIKAAEK